MRPTEPPDIPGTRATVFGIGQPEYLPLPPVTDAELLEAHAERCGIPEHMREGLVAYVLRRRRTGDFLRAVLENNLKEACDRADDENKRALFAYVFFLYNHAPTSAWGSPANVKAWLEGGRQ